MARTDQTINDTQPKKLRSRRCTQTGFSRSTQSANSPMSPAGSQPKSPGFRARGRKGQALASARDRRALRERNVAERRRVEKMLATAPLPDDRRANERDRHGHHEENRFLDFGRVSGLSKGCPVCGESRVVTDEVIHGGTLSMSECLHCDHRWTTRPKARWVDLGARMNRAGRPRAAVTA